MYKKIALLSIIAIALASCGETTKYEWVQVASPQTNYNCYATTNLSQDKFVCLPTGDIKADDVVHGIDKKTVCLKGSGCSKQDSYYN